MTDSSPNGTKIYVRTNGSASPRFSLNGEDVGAIFRGLLIAVVGAALTYLTDTIPNVELGEWTPVVVAGWSVIANAVRKWIASR